MPTLSIILNRINYSNYSFLFHFKAVMSIIRNILIIHFQINYSKMMLLIKDISIFAIILINQLEFRSRAPTRRYLDSCVDKNCWYGIIAADTFRFDFQLSVTLQRRWRQGPGKDDC